MQYIIIDYAVEIWPCSSENHLFPLVGGPWPCSSEMLAMWFWTCLCAVGRVPSPSLPVWSVNHGCAARRRSSFGSGLMRVQSGEGHLFPSSLSTISCSLGTLAMRFRLVRVHSDGRPSTPMSVRAHQRLYHNIQKKEDSPSVENG